MAFEAWLAHIEAEKPHVASWIEQIYMYGLKPLPLLPHELLEVGCLPFKVSMEKEGAVTTIRFLLFDHNSNSDLVITNMTTLPEERQRQGMGMAAVRKLRAWAYDCGMQTVRATQVQQQSEGFWKRIGFTRASEPNPCNDYVRLT